MRSNVTSQVSLGTRVKVWVESVPIVTRAVLALCVAIYVLELVFGRVTGRVCLSPVDFVQRPLASAPRVLTAPLFHLGLLHLAMNMLSWVPMAAPLERRVGSLRLASMLLAFAGVGGLIHVVGADALLVTRLYTRMSCSAGLSGVIFAVLVCTISTAPSPTQSVFGLFAVPTQVYPWVLLLVMQVVLPGVSFMGHLAGILVGYLYVFGFLRWAVLSPRVVAAIESARPLGPLVRLPAYIVGQQTGLALPLSTGPAARPRSPAAAAGGGVVRGVWGRLFGGGSSSSTSTSTNGGHMLGSAYGPVPPVLVPTAPGEDATQAEQQQQQ